MRLNEIHLRDPFIFADKKSSKYYLYGSVKDRSKQSYFEVYESKNLQEWTYGGEVFCANDGFWGKSHFWAPELHFIDGKYYLFATFRGEESAYHRSHILVCDTPNGKFTPLPSALTPESWSSLDATYVEENGKKYTVFCHEWIQLKDGEMCLMELNEDLTPAAPPATLFKASDAPWAINARKNETCYVTDGPWLIRKKNGWFMLWSSFCKSGYAVAYATAERLTGPWKQQETPLLEIDGGHAMLFESFDNKTYLVCHSPNSLSERPVLIEVHITDEKIEIL